MLILHLKKARCAASKSCNDANDSKFRGPLTLKYKQAPYSPTSNPFGVRPRTRTPAGSLAAGRRDSSAAPSGLLFDDAAAEPDSFIGQAPAEGGHHAAADADGGGSGCDDEEIALTLPLTPTGVVAPCSGGTGASTPAAPSPSFSDMAGFSGVRAPERHAALQAAVQWHNTAFISNLSETSQLCTPS